MPTLNDSIDKFKLITVLSTVIQLLEEDRLQAGKISFNRTATGIYTVSTFFSEKKK